MKHRLYACVVILAAVLALAWYSNASMRRFCEEIDAVFTQAETALDEDDTVTAMQTVAQGVELCRTMRTKMTPFLRVEHFTEIESSLRAALGYLERDVPEEALGELRRAAVKAESLERLSRRII